MLHKIGQDGQFDEMVRRPFTLFVKLIRRFKFLLKKCQINLTKREPFISVLFERHLWHQRLRFKTIGQMLPFLSN